MSDLEKNFEALKHHEVVPPRQTWEQLSRRLEQKRQRKAATYWRVAAAVALLLLSTTVFWLLRGNDQASPLAGGTVPDRVQPTPLAADAVPATPLAEETRELPAAPSGTATTTDATASLQRTAPAATLSAKRKQASTPDQRVVPPSAVQPSVALTASERDHRRPLHQVESAAAASTASSSTTATSRVIAPLKLIEKPERDATVADADPGRTSSVDSTTVAPRRTITVIYRPGGKRVKAGQSDQGKGLFAKTLSLLGEVKENGIGYSELRSAKSELIDTMFSRGSE